MNLNGHSSAPEKEGHACSGGWGYIEGGGWRLSKGPKDKKDTKYNKRAHHNALERKRRDHIKDSFHSLRDSVPALQGEKVGKASRAQILDKATEYIQYMRRKNHTHQQDIDDLKRQNALLEQQVRALEKVKGSAQLQASYSSSDSSLYTNPKGSAVSAFDGGSDSSSESEAEEPPNRKKLRVEAS
uniref:Protein max n=2 Tax=Percomorphaceae TaxID=1489872 RepID=A0A8C3B1P5_CYCLU